MVTLPIGSLIKEAWLRCRPRRWEAQWGINPISIIIPCHRVVGTNGSLTGYAGGIDKKIALLQLENSGHDGFIDP